MPEIKIGYKLCGEEQSPQELIDCARRAEEVGFDFAMIRTTTTPSPNKELKREFENWREVDSLLCGGYRLLGERRERGSPLRKRSLTETRP